MLVMHEPSLVVFWAGYNSEKGKYCDIYSANNGFMKNLPLGVLCHVSNEQLVDFCNIRNGQLVYPVVSVINSLYTL